MSNFEDNYVSFAKRLPLFLEKYPPEKYLFTVSANEALSLSPAILGLYEKAIENGLSPESIGLPAIPRTNTFVFKAELFRIDENGEHVFIQSASAMRQCDHLKDFEVGETNARQRLISIMGFGSESFDKDEAYDVQTIKNQKETGSNAFISESQSESTFESNENDFFQDQSVDEPYKQQHLEEDDPYSGSNPSEHQTGSFEHQSTDEQDYPDDAFEIEENKTPSVTDDEIKPSPVSEANSDDPALQRIIKQLNMKASAAGVQLDQEKLKDIKSAKEYLRNFAKTLA